MSRRRTRTPQAEALSQHRLRDDSVAERIVASTGLAPPALVIEAGAGEGLLTAAIARHAGRVIAIEQDRGCYAALRGRFRDDNRVHPVLGDFLAIELPRSRAYSVVSNVPYAITAQLMRRLLAAPRPPESAFLVMQREAALHWTGDGGETTASVAAKRRFVFEIALALRRQDFVPWPRVNSVLLSVRRRKRPLLDDREARAFEVFVSRGFGRGRGSLQQNLGGALQAARFKAAALQLDFDEKAAPRELLFEQWLRLFELARGGRPGD